MKQTVFTFKIGEKSSDHKLDFIYTPTNGGFVKIGDHIFKCETMIDEFTNNESVQIRRISLKEHNLS